MGNIKRKKLYVISRIVSTILTFILIVEAGLGNGSIVLAEPVEEINEIVQEDTQSKEMTESSEQETADIAENPQILFEVESLREQNEKHYRLSDGSMMAAEYAMDIHYENENGDWAEIDNRFIYEPATESDAMEGYVTADGSVEFKFAPDTSGEVVRVINEEYSVSFELITEEGAPEPEYVQISEQPLEETEAEMTESMEAEEEPSVSEITETDEDLNMEETTPASSIPSVPITFIKGEILNVDSIPEDTEALATGTFSIDSTTEILSNATETVSGAEEDIWTGDWNTESSKESLTEQAAVDNAVTSVGYENALPGTSLQYIASGSSLKEYILVEARQDSYRYAFYMNLENLVPQMQEDNSILLKDSETEEIIYEIPSAFMTDAAGKYSNAVTMSVEEKSDGVYILVIEADKEWINAPDRTFPVQIDPTLNQNFTKNTTSFKGSYVCSGDTDLNSNGYSSMFIGYDSSGYGRYIDYFRLRYLPELPKNSVICSAMFSLGYTAYSNDGMSSMRAVLKEITGASWSDQYTWDSKPNTGSAILDYQKIIQAEAGQRYIGWDITGLVKDYYAAKNEEQILSFSLEAYESMSNANGAKATLTLNNNIAKPVLSIFYRDTKGVEGYYTYQTHSIGNAGTAYVGDYSGQLTLVKPAVSYSSTIFPYSLNLVYNSAFSDKHFSVENNLNTTDYSTMRIATGWKLSAQESIVEKQITNQDGTSTYLVYNDSDGTDHYFHPQGNSTTVYEDEDGLDLTITIDNQFYYLTDENGNKKTFAFGYLYKIEDESGNAIHIMYNNCTDPSNNIVNSTGGNRITSVISKPKNKAAETIFTLYYNTGSHLDEIRDSFGNRCKIVAGSCTDSSGTSHAVIAEVKHYDTSNSAYVSNAKYTYASGHMGMLRAYDMQTKTGVAYSYDNSPTGQRLSGYYGYYASTIGGTPKISGNVSITSDELRQTVYRNAGSDGDLNNADDQITKYLFNAAGQTVNAMSEDTEGNLLGVTASAYTANEGTKNTNNRMTGSISSGQAGQNMFSNGGFELPADGHESSPSSVATGWSSSGTAARRIHGATTGFSHSGLMHYNLYNASTTGTSRIYRRVDLEGGKTYTFSAYVNTSNAGTISDSGGVYLEVMLSGVEIIAESPKISYKTNPDIESGWQRISTTFTMPYDGYISMIVHWDNAYGTVWVDDLQLEEASAASRFNFVHNGSFETADSREGWTASSDLAIGSAAEQKQGNNSLKMTGSPDSVVYIEQTIQVNRSSDTTFLLSGWSMADSIPGLASEIENVKDENGAVVDTSSYKYWGMTLVLNYKDGAESDYFHVPFDSYVRDWQYAAASIVPKKAGKTISTARLRLYYQNNANEAYFDGISLTEEPAQTYTYNEDGKLISVESTGNGAENQGYDANQNLETIQTAGSGTYKNIYGDTERPHLLTGTQNDVLKVDYEYDPNGQKTETIQSNTVDSLKMSASSTYSEGLQIGTIDVNGSAIGYNYDEERRLIEVILPNGIVNSTVYDETWGNVSQNFQSEYISVGYTYTNGMLTQISRGGYLYPPTVSNRTKLTQNYHFTYNEFGNVTGTAVGNYKLAEYEYDTSGLKQQLMRYGGNGTPLATITYGYDELDRMTSAAYNDVNNNKTKTYGYQYSSDGNLAGITENGEQAYVYDYDTLGRLIHSSKVEDGKIVFYTDHVYDTSNRITSQKWQIEDDSYSETYTYNGKDGTLQSMTAAGGESISYQYDNLKRLDYNMLMYGSSQIMKTDYTYRARTGDSVGNTTSQISKMQFIKPSNSAAILPALNYTYDAMGNITSVTPDGGTATTYSYDEQNQLKTERKGTVYTSYTYDTYGNIRSAKDYQDGFGMISGYTFEYGDSQWRDLLTKVSYTSTDGTTVTGNLTYDAIGNPIIYSNGQNTWNMTWQYGRQLAAAQKGSTVVTYEYDVDGIREKKTVGSKTYDYVTLDGQVIRETITTGSSAPVVVDYMYDNSGEPYKIVVTSGSISYAGYYVLNQQGDVIAIIDASGNVLVSYSYNAWGVPTTSSFNGTTGSALYTYNSLKYRGYYYDSETGLYYVSSRYYDPEIGRFINADAAIGQIGNVQGTNMFAYCFNNPVNMSDPTGNWPKLSTIFAVVAVAAVAVAAVAAVVVTCGAAAPAMAVVGGGIAGGISAGTIATAAAVGSAAVTVAKVAAVASAASYVTEKAVEKTVKRNNSVYVLKDDTGTVQYVGRTNNVDRRRAAHSANPARAGLEMEVIASGLNLPESRALEQAGMAYYHTINTANKMNNQINSVSPKYWGAFKDLALGTLNYGWNQMSNEILYWTGN